MALVGYNLLTTQNFSSGMKYPFRRPSIPERGKAREPLQEQGVGGSLFRLNQAYSYPLSHLQIHGEGNSRENTALRSPSPPCLDEVSARLQERREYLRQRHLCVAQAARSKTPTREDALPL